MKYTTVELEILKQGGKQALEEFHKAKRKCSGTRANLFIESKKYKKEKYKANYED